MRRIAANVAKVPELLRKEARGSAKRNGPELEGIGASEEY